MIRLLLVDDHRAFLEPLAFMLAREDGLSVVAQAHSVAEAKTMLDGIDVALVDLHVGNENGLDLIREIRDRGLKVSTLILTAVDDPIEAADAIDAGAAGVLHKSVSPSEILLAVHRLTNGLPIQSAQELMDLWQRAGMARADQTFARRAVERLTSREREIIQGLASGRSNREIADELGIAYETVRTHLVNISTKLGVHSQTQTLAFALRHGIVWLPPDEG